MNLERFRSTKPRSSWRIVRNILFGAGALVALVIAPVVVQVIAAAPAIGLALVGDCVWLNAKPDRRSSTRLCQAFDSYMFSAPMVWLVRDLDDYQLVVRHLASENLRPLVPATIREVVWPVRGSEKVYAENYWGMIFLNRAFLEESGALYPFDRDATRAMRWYLRAAVEGHPYAQYTVALASAHGWDSLQKDEAEAFRWAQASANQGGAGSAQSLVGMMYLTGFGVTEDPEEGLRWIRIEAERGGRVGRRLLGWLYGIWGAGGAQDFDVAYELFRYHNSQEWKAVARQWSDVVGHPEDPRKLRDFSFRRDLFGSPESAVNIGFSILAGADSLDVDGDGRLDGPLNWFRAAVAELTEPPHRIAAAEFGMGLVYELGFGVDVDKTLAEQWYRKAANKGHAAADHALERLMSLRSHGASGGFPINVVAGWTLPPVAELFRQQRQRSEPGFDEAAESRDAVLRSSERARRADQLKKELGETPSRTLRWLGRVRAGG